MRVGAGNKNTNTKTFNFWAITPGLKYKIDDKWSIKEELDFVTHLIQISTVIIQKH